jgi:hypothetical protein
MLSATTAFQQRDAINQADRIEISLPATSARIGGPSPVEGRGSGITSPIFVNQVSADSRGPAALAMHVAGDFGLNVPFRTQKDGARYQGANCGPASLAMVLQSFNMTETNSDLRWQIQGYMGNQGRGGGTNLQDVASVGKDFGLSPIGLYAGEDFARWSLQDIEAQLREGHPVIALVKYRLLPDHLNATIGYDHYVVLHGVKGEEFLYHDPAYELAADGASHWISRDQLSLAMRSASIPQQAVAFAPGVHVGLSYRPV